MTKPKQFVTRFKSGFYDEMLEDAFQSTLPLAFALAIMMFFMFMLQELTFIRNSEYNPLDAPYSFMVLTGPDRNAEAIPRR